MAIAKRPICTNQGFKSLVCNEDVDNELIYYLLQTMVSEMLGLAIGSTFLEISKKALASIELSLPPLPEQRAIAAALSDADGYIAALERLIAKKRNIKKGAMQVLLTGKRRLPGFSGEWINMNLAANSTLKARIGWQGLTTAEYLDEGYSYLITGIDFDYGKIAWASCHFVDKYRYEQDANIQVENGDVLITKDGTIGKVAIVSGLNRKATLNSGVFVLRPKAGAYDGRYTYYILLSQIFTDFLDKLAAGSTINHLYQKDFVTFEFMVPPTIAEQTAIADILSDMDAEIDALTAKLSKARGIKQGMMQELLTGRIRLVDEETNTEAAVERIPASKVTPVVKQNNHNKAIEDAVILGVVADLYATKDFPLSPFYAQKLPYLLHRHMEGIAEGYHKLAAGPYNAELKYKTALPIATKNRYVITRKETYMGRTYQAMLVGDNIEQAKGYFAQWHGDEPLQWLQQFRFIKNRRDELELLTTVDMAMVELRESNVAISVHNVRNIIQSSKEWKAKLKREIFSDANIARAIEWSKKLFGQEGLTRE